jgi:GNAT superfamily N-acetyltransferase
MFRSKRDSGGQALAYCHPDLVYIIPSAGADTNRPFSPGFGPWAGCGGLIGGHPRPRGAQVLQIKRVLNRRDLKAFVRLPFGLYAKCPQWVPPLDMEQLEILDPARNPAFAEADARLYLALRDGQPVGRVAAIHSRAANQHQHGHNLRFGWFETVEDYAVARALLGAVEDWARELGLDTITGPQGFCDLDPQGMLIEGFQHLPTIVTYYNHPFYPLFLERYGFSKDMDYVELLLTRGEQSGLPPRLQRLVAAVQGRSQWRVLEFRRRREALAWMPQVMEVLNEAFAGLYGEVPLSQAQVKHYMQKFLPFLDKDLLVGVVDRNNRLQGFAVALPSLSRAFQKAQGRLLPFGWWHIWRGLRDSEIIDFYLVGVRKNCQGRGLPALIMARLYEKAMSKRFVLAESNPILENNQLSLALYEPFKPLQHKRRRVFTKTVAGPLPPPDEEKHEPL